MLLIVTNDKGRDFAVRYVDRGEAYGRDFCLTNVKDKMGSGEPLCEFWDMTYPHGPVEPGSTVTGQFTGARYYVSTILGLDKWSTGMGGLCLDGGNADSWSLDEATMRIVRGWLNGVMGRTPALVV